MRKAWQDVLEVFFYGLRAARQVHDQGLAAQHADTAAEHPARCDGKAMVPHGLGNAGRVAFGYAQSHLRGDIPGRKAGAAGGEDQVHLTGIRKAQQLGFELGGIVRQKQRFLHLVACGGEHLHNERAAFVLPFAAAALSEG